MKNGNSLFKRLSVFLLPGAILLAAHISSSHFDMLPASVRENADYAPWLVFAAGLCLSFHFNRGRAFFVLLLLLLFHWSLNRVPSQPLFDALCLLLPVNITIFCLMREKGLASLSARMRAGFIALQSTLVVCWLKFSHPALLAAGPPEPASTSVPPFLAVPAWTLPVMGTGLALVGAKALVRRNPIDGGMFGALACLAVIFTRANTPWVPAVFATGAGLILTLSILRDSYNMAFRDELTGLSSRRALNEEMAGFGRRYAMAMLDVDHFKRVNDTHGHDVGDQVLKMVASKVCSVVPGGKAYRYGGEEVVIVFPRKTLGEVLPLLEDLRRTIADYQLRIRDTNRPVRAHDGKKMRAGRDGRTCVSVTVSIGAAERNDELRTPEEVLKAADCALYRAKNKGRNRLCC